jgi:hemolysin III
MMTPMESREMGGTESPQPTRGLGPLVVPRLRGVLHQYAFFVVLAIGLVLILLASTGRGRLAVGVYVTGLASCLGTSALYHRGRWSPRMKAWLGRIDHSMIFVLIAGTYTPICVLALSGVLGTSLLISVWAGALAGIVMSLVWWRPPVLAEVLPYVVLGWIAVIALPQLAAVLGWTALGLMVGGGALYTVGAVIYGLEWPNPRPAIFGFHEIFHSLTLAAAGTHLAVVVVFLLPRA